MSENDDFKDLRKAAPEDLDVRERILRTAIILFNANGIHTTGIDRIIAESDVAKMSFYKHFPSKGKLVAEYLRNKHQYWFRGVDAHTGDTQKNKLDRFLGIFDFLKEWFSEPDFRGCPFIKGLSEFSKDYEPEVLECLNQHFSRLQNFVEESIKTIRPNDFSLIVPQIMTLISGSIILAQASGDPGIADVNKRVAKLLLS